MNEMALAGSLAVSARWEGGCLHDWRVRLVRPPVGAALAGLEPDEALARVPLYFSLCSGAQREAGRLALAAAGIPLGDGPPAWSLWAECLHEHLWRLLLDWPRTFGEAPAIELFATWRAARARGRLALVEATRRLLEGEVFGGPGGGLVARGLLRLQAQEGTAPVCAGLEARGASIRAAAEELSRDLVYPHGTVGDMLAGRGEAWVHTARGALHHRVHVNGERVLAWLIEAPTDRNFADETGIVRRLPPHLPTLAAARTAVERAVLLLDPCVPFVVEVDNA